METAYKPRKYAVSEGLFDNKYISVKTPEIKRIKKSPETLVIAGDSPCKKGPGGENLLQESYQTYFMSFS